MVAHKTWSFKMASNFRDLMGKILVFWIVGHSIGCGRLQVVKNENNVTVRPESSCGRSQGVVHQSFTRGWD